MYGAQKELTMLLDRRNKNSKSKRILTIMPPRKTQIKSQDNQERRNDTENAKSTRFWFW